jgi:hypothetical protein
MDGNIPTMTGGVDHAELLRVCKHHFIPKTPKDTGTCVDLAHHRD